MGSILRCLFPVTEGDMKHICIVAIKGKKMGFSSYCLSLSLYIMSSYLRRYSVLYELNTLEAGRSRWVCGVIVVEI